MVSCVAYRLSHSCRDALVLFWKPVGALVRTVTSVEAPASITSIVVVEDLLFFLGKFREGGNGSAGRSGRSRGRGAS